MVSKESRKEVRAKKHMRIRNRFSGTAERPRLAVFRSNNHMYAQIIDDTVGNTLVAASTLEKSLRYYFNNNLLGPEYPVVSRVKNMYIKQMVLKINKETNSAKSKEILKGIIDDFKCLNEFKSVKIQLDVDPISI